jgi:tetratricopeptide (TPR) repeat protein
MIKCPVCPTRDIPKTASACPNCGVDLSAIHRLREITKSYYNESLKLTEVGAIDSAIIKVMAALNADTQFVEARKLLGKLLWKKKQFSQAIEQWKQVLAITPEDKDAINLLSCAKQHVKIRMMSIVVCLIVGIAFLSSLVAVPTYLLFATKGYGESNKAGLASTAHIDTQVLYQAVSDQITDRRKRDSNDLQTFEQYIQTQLDGLHQKIERLGEQQTEVISELSKAFDANKKEILTTQVIIDTQNKHLTQSFVSLLECFRPTNANELLVSIEKLGSKLEQLRKLEEKYKSRGIFLIDAFNVNDVRNKIAHIENQLDSLEAEYNTQVVPWMQAMETVKELQNELPISTIK